MPANEILQEAKKLHRVSDSLATLAEENAPLEAALTILAGTVRNSATLLEVLVALRLGPVQGLNSASN
jgi:type II secretory pathway component PulF